MITPEEQLMLENAKVQIESANLNAQRLENQNMSQAQFLEQQDKGMAEEQLNLSEELEKIEHLLRGHIIKRDANGIEFWDEGLPEMKILNEYGVRLIMQVLNLYLSKRKLLSNYSEEQVNEKMRGFCIELADLVFMKYEEMGLDTPNKRKCYPILITEIKDAVHDVYSRAIAGKERDSIRKRWNLNENVGTPLQNQNQGEKKSWLR